MLPANQASVALIERDLGVLGSFCPQKSFTWEMLFFLHLNFEKIPSAVPVLTTYAGTACIPMSFAGKDLELVPNRQLREPHWRFGDS